MEEEAVTARRDSKHIISLTSLLLALTNLGLARFVASSRAGPLTDASGTVVPGAQIVIANQGTDIEVKASTGRQVTARSATLKSPNFPGLVPAVPG